MTSPEPFRTVFHDSLISFTALAIAIPPHRRASLFQVLHPIPGKAWRILRKK